MPGTLTSIAIYCGSSPGTDPAYTRVAGEVGRLVAERGLTLIYGGGHVGMMGAVADAALSAGGRVHGVITRALQEKEVAHLDLTVLEVVETMHERKARMADLADGFLMLPGGYGTLDEFFEVVTWSQLGVHAKPCGVLEVNGYFAWLRAFLDQATGEGFVRDAHRHLVVLGQDPAVLLDELDAWEPLDVSGWIRPAER